MMLRAVFILCLTITDAANNYVNEKNSNIICKAKTCIPKCCPEKEYVIYIKETDENKCVYRENDLDFTNITLYDDYEYGEKVDSKFSDLLILPNFKNFSLSADATSFGVGRLTLSEKGRLQLDVPNMYKRWRIFESDKYCIEYVALDEHPDEIELHYFVIFNSDDGAETSSNSLYYMAAMCVSCIFLVLVLLVYCLLPELRNLGGKILMAYVLSLLLAFLSLSSVQVNTYDEDTCLGITAVIYYAFLASFCWMSVMSYDIFWTFRGYAKARRIHRRGENFKFLMYCLYAWGVPLPMTIFLVVMNKVDLKDKPWIVTPQIPTTGCFLRDEQKFVYLYAPMLILIACNWFFYLLTVFNIWRLSRGTAVLHSAAAGNATAHQAQKGRFMIYLKLSVVMGVNWLLEVISSFYPNLGGLWWVPDIYNLLIGLSIFLIFVCKKKILQDIGAKFRSFHSQRPWFYNSETNTSNTSTLDTTLNQNRDISLEVSKHPDGLVRGRRYDVSV